MNPIQDDGHVTRAMDAGMLTVARANKLKSSFAYRGPTCCNTAEMNVTAAVSSTLLKTKW